jgi:hypothetical protein
LEKEKEMPVKIEEPDYAAEVQWITRLPNGGGEWGAGIVNTVRAAQATKEEMEGQRAELTRKINDYKRLLRATLTRAEKESTMLFPNTAIVAAKGQETT